MNHVKFNRGNKILSKNASECIKKVQIISAKIASIYKAVYGTTRFQFFTIYCILILFFFTKVKILTALVGFKLMACQMRYAFETQDLEIIWIWLLLWN